MKNQNSKINFMSVLLFIGMFFIVVALMAVFGGLIMKPFGFRYQTFWSLILYFTVVAIITLPFDLVIMNVPKTMMKLGKITKVSAMITQFIMDMLFSCAGFYVADLFMDDVTASLESIFVVSALFAILGVVEMAKLHKELK